MVHAENLHNLDELVADQPGSARTKKTKSGKVNVSLIFCQNTDCMTLQLIPKRPMAIHLIKRVPNFLLGCNILKII